MASDLDRISQALRSLAAVPFPDGFLQEVELALVNAHLDATKAARAKKLLADRGAMHAAAVMNCSVRQLYRMAQTRVPNWHDSGATIPDHPQSDERDGDVLLNEASRVAAG